MRLITLKQYVEARFCNTAEAAESLGLCYNSLTDKIRKGRHFVHQHTGKFYIESTLGRPAGVKKEQKKEQRKEYWL